MSMKTDKKRPEVYSCAQVSTLPLSESVIPKRPKYDPFMAQTWSSHGPSNGFVLNLNQCAKGCSMLNFTILDQSHSALFLEMAKIWRKHGLNMVLQIGFPLT